MNGPRDCDCSECMGKPDAERGKPPCEYANHCCDFCHLDEICTIDEHVAERRKKTFSQRIKKVFEDLCKQEFYPDLSSFKTRAEGIVREAEEDLRLERERMEKVLEFLRHHIDGYEHIFDMAEEFAQGKRTEL